MCPAAAQVGEAHGPRAGEDAVAAGQPAAEPVLEEDGPGRAVPGQGLQEGPNPDPGPGAGWPVMMACSLGAALPPHVMAAGTQSALLSRQGLRGLTPQAGWEGSAPPGVRKDVIENGDLDPSEPEGG